EHLSKLTGQTTVVKEQLTTSGRGWSTNVSRSTHEVSRPLLTPDEAMRMKGARKNAQGMITEPGNMVIYVAGYPAIMGLQPLYFRDAELARRARIPADSSPTKKCCGRPNPTPQHPQKTRPKRKNRPRWLTPAYNNARKTNLTRASSPHCTIHILSFSWPIAAHDTA